MGLWLKMEYLSILVSEITIAGNFKDIFKNITLADDLEFKYSTNAPTMLIEGMVVAGKMKDFCIIGSGISGATIASSLSKKYSLDVYDKARGCRRKII